MPASVVSAWSRWLSLKEHLVQINRSHLIGITFHDHPWQKTTTLSPPRDKSSPAGGRDATGRRAACSSAWLAASARLSAEWSIVVSQHGSWICRYELNTTTSCHRKPKRGIYGNSVFMEWEATKKVPTSSSTHDDTYAEAYMLTILTCWMMKTRRKAVATMYVHLMLMFYY